MSKLLSKLLLHNHFFFEEPRIFYMHVMASGTPTDLAHKLKPALDLMGQGSKAAVNPSTAKPSIDIARLTQKERRCSSQPDSKLHWTSSASNKRLNTNDVGSDSASIENRLLQAAA